MVEMYGSIWPLLEGKNTMSPISFVIILLALSSLVYWGAKRKAFAVATGGGQKMHSRPGYYGMLTALEDAWMKRLPPR